MLSRLRLHKIVIASSSSANLRRGCGGFSLIELAVVIFIVGLLLGGIVVPLATQSEIRKYDQTQRILDQARESLIGYAAANGRFPCPASASSTTGAGNGVEDGNAATGVCNPATVTGTNVYYGFLPATTLGFTPVDANGYALDAWGRSWKNRIRYAVSSVSVNSTANCTATPISRPFTAPNGMRSAGMSCIAAATNLLYVCNSGTGVTGTDCNTAVKLASSVPVVIWSVGPNAATSGGTSVDELQNPNPTAGFSADRIFVSTNKRAAGEAGGEFDDIVTWIGSPTLFNRLVAAGQLP
jgi:prepilin-type N-terminal cleavage/methylation domain-containing protein